MSFQNQDLHLGSIYNALKFVQADYYGLLYVPYSTLHCSYVSFQRCSLYKTRSCQQGKQLYANTFDTSKEPDKGRGPREPSEVQAGSTAGTLDLLRWLTERDEKARKEREEQDRRRDEQLQKLMELVVTSHRRQRHRDEFDTEMGDRKNAGGGAT